MSRLRTKEVKKKYDDYIAAGGLSDGCELCKKDTQVEFKHWRVVENIFPYDRVAENHDMLIPLRHKKEIDLNDAEKDELYQIKQDYVSEKYHFILEASNPTKSIPQHFHLHLLKIKDNLNI